MSEAFIAIVHKAYEMVKSQLAARRVSYLRMKLLGHTSLIGRSSSERELIDSHDTLSESSIDQRV